MRYLLYWVVLGISCCFGQYAAAQVNLSDYYRHQAEKYYDQDKYPEAARYYQKAYALVRTTDPARAANLCVDMSSMAHRKGEFREAANYCWAGFNHLRQLQQVPDSLRFKLHSNLGVMYNNLYLRDSAVYHFSQADVVLVRTPAVERQIPDYVLYHYNNQGGWYRKLGNYSRAIVYLNQARAVALRYKKNEDSPFIDANLGFCYDFVGKTEMGLQYMQNATANYQKKDFYKTNFLMGLGWLSQKNGSFKSALLHYNQALDVVNHIGNDTRTFSEKAELFRLLGVLYRKQKDFDKAKEYVASGIEFCLKQGILKGTRIAQLYMEQGQWHGNQKQYWAAALSYQKAIDALLEEKTETINAAIETDKILNKKVLLEVLLEMANTRTQQYRDNGNTATLLTAAQTYCDAAQLKTNLQTGYEAEETKLLFTAQQHDLFPEAIAIVYEIYTLRRQPKWREALFRLFEQSAASSLHDALHLRDLYPRNLPDSLLIKEQALRQKLPALRLLNQPSPEDEAKWQKAQLEWYQLVATFERNYPAYYQLKYQQFELTTTALRQHLNKQTIYVAYRQAGSHIYIFVANQTAVEIIRQPIDTTLWQQAKRQLRQSLYQNPGFGKYDGVGSATLAYRYLIEPLRPWLIDQNHLIVERDWDFQWLPFEVLESGKRVDDYMAKKYIISYAYSAQLFINQAIHKAEFTKLPTLLIAPFARVTNHRDFADTDLRPLTASEADARRIGGELWIGARATKAQFMAANFRRSIIHLATHAQTDDTDPSQSFVAFYPKDDYRLRTEEIYQLPLQNTRLVVLSACEAGNGRTARGEGVLSLARAFSYAGCASVITTLWDAQDQCTSFLSVHLHQHLQSGLPIDDALQQARQDFFDSALFLKYNHPHYWANFVLLGKTDPVVEDKSFLQKNAMGLVGILIVLLLVIGFFHKKGFYKPKEARF